MNEQFLQAIEESLKVTNEIKREQWTEEQLLAYFGRRTIHEIKEQGTVHYANPCSALTAVLKYELEQRGYDSFLYLEILNNKVWVPEGVTALHFGLGLHPENNLYAPKDELYFLHIKTHNQAILGKGPLPEDERKEVSRLLEPIILEGRLQPEKNLFDNYPDTTKTLSIDIQKEARRLAEEDKNPERFKEYTRRINGNAHLYLEKRL